jgi:hAT family C-terminal dimerisation region
MREPVADPTDDPIKWWITKKNTFPNLWQMGIDILGIPATSTPSERLFSKAGEIYTSHRKCLQGKTSQALLNLGTWWDVGGLPGVATPVLKHPHIEYLRSKKKTRLPVALDAGKGEWKLDPEQEQDENLIGKGLEMAAIDEDEIPIVEGLEIDAFDDDVGISMMEELESDGGNISVVGEEEIELADVEENIIVEVGEQESDIFEVDNISEVGVEEEGIDAADEEIDIETDIESDFE